MSSETIIDEQEFRNSEPITGEKDFLIKREIAKLEEYQASLPKEEYKQVDSRHLPKEAPSVYGRDASKDEWYDNHPNWNR